MALVEHHPDASPEVAKAARSMTKSQAHDFAATKEKGLPTRSGERKGRHHSLRYKSAD
jgi:hypothetical protein